MDVPDLVRQALGDEEIRASVSLGDEDAVCMTPTRTLVYRGEGLLSDETIEEYPHDAERVDVSEGRRKTKFTLAYVDGSKSFTVPSDRGETMLERLLEGVLGAAGVAEAGETVTGVYRFSELTLIVTENRIVRHIGDAVWDEETEGYAYGDVTGLSFEEGNVATQVVLEVDGRPERIKAPSEEARLLRRSIEETLFDYYDVDSLEELNETVGGDAEEHSPADGEDATGQATGGNDPTPQAGSGDIGLDPLVSEGDDGGRSGGRDSGFGEPPGSTGSSSSGTSGVSGTGGSSTGTGTGAETESGAEAASREDIEEVNDQLAELTEAVKRQNELLERHNKTIKQLIKELRQGR
ncbi:hypothetical protein BRC83_01100 [Halobacteriales archaeon QS_1_68_17]|nr:MAG: hypothetical protein BRC83_01100 [Halobacteriales archaeon QS_1_68_17]